VGLVFQHFSLFEALTVVENISLTMLKIKLLQLKLLSQVANYIHLPVHYSTRLAKKKFLL